MSHAFKKNISEFFAAEKTRGHVCCDSQLYLQSGKSRKICSRNLSMANYITVLNGERKRERFRNHFPAVHNCFVSPGKLKNLWDEDTTAGEGIKGIKMIATKQLL